MDPLKDCLNRAEHLSNQKQRLPSSSVAIEEKKIKQIQKNALRFGGGQTLYSEDMAEDVNVYMRYLEEKLMIPANFLEYTLIKGHMRQTLVTWLFHVQKRFELLNETLSLTVYLLDRSLHTMIGITTKSLQLVGVACLFVACKFEEIEVSNSADLVFISADAFSKEDLLEMEQKLMLMCHFQLGRPHAIQFLRRFRFFLTPDYTVYCLARYILDASLLCYEVAHQKPSMIAAAALCLASFAYRKKISAHQCQEAMGVDVDVVVKVARVLVNPTIQFMDPNEKVNILRERYIEDVALSTELINRLKQFGNNFE